MSLDPEENSPLSDNSGAQELDGEHIRYVETSDAWSDWRDKLAEEIYEQWRASRHELEMMFTWYLFILLYS